MKLSVQISPENQISLFRGDMPPKKGKKGGKKQDDDWGEDDKKVNFS